MEKNNNQTKAAEPPKGAPDALAASIDAALDLVDSEDFPNSWSPELDLGSVCDEFELLWSVVSPVFRHESLTKYIAVLDGMLDDRSRFCLKAPKSKRLPIRDEIENAYIDRQTADQALPISIGFALGLRTAGISRKCAHVILARFLRNYSTEAQKLNDKS